MKRQFIKTVSALVVAASFVASVNAEIRYNVTDLGEGTAWSVNNNGQVVGDSPGGATLFDASGGGNNIILGGVTAYSINGHGQVVGYGEVGSYVHHAMLFDPTGQGSNIDLTPFATEWTPSYGKSINIHGQIVGQSGGAVLFDPTGSGNNLYLGVGEAQSINDIGQIVGHDNTQAILFDPTGQHQNNIYLGTLGGDRSIARSINNSGQIVGIAWVEVGKAQEQHATLFDPTGGGNNIDLGTLGRKNSDALCINNKGAAVGIVYQVGEQPGDCYATLFDISGQGNNIILNTLIDPTCGWNLMSAKAINDNGWIVGFGVNPDGNSHAFLLTPIPEPCTVLLFGLGAVMLRKKR